MSLFAGVRQHIVVRERRIPLSAQSRKQAAHGIVMYGCTAALLLICWGIWISAALGPWTALWSLIIMIAFGLVSMLFGMTAIALIVTRDRDE